MCTPNIINIFSKVGQSVFVETDFVISITEVTCLVLQKTGIFQFSVDHKKSALKCCQWLDGDSDIYSGSRIQCSFGKQYQSEHLILFYYWDSKTQLTIFFFRHSLMFLVSLLREEFPSANVIPIYKKKSSSTKQNIDPF